MGVFLNTLYFIAIVLYFLMGISALIKDAKSNLNRIFFIMCIILCGWSLTTLYMMISPNAETAIIYRNISSCIWSVFYCIVLYFILLLTGKNKNLDNKLIILIFLPGVISTFIYVLNPLSSIDMIGFDYGWAFKVWDMKFVPLKDFFSIYFIIYLIIDFVLLYKWSKNSKYKREKRQAELIGFSIVMTIFTEIICRLILIISGIVYMPPIGILLMLIAFAGIWYSMIRYKFNTIAGDEAVLDILNIMNEGLIILDYEGIIQNTNKYTENLLKYNDKELVKKSVHEIFAENNQWLLQNEFSSMELQLISKDNEMVNVLASYSILKDKSSELFGENLGAVLIFQDIYQIKQAQDKLIIARNNMEIAFQQRSNELAMTNIKLEMEIKHRRAKEEEIENLTCSDQLTGLPNRRFFNELLNEAIGFSQNNDSVLGVIMLDIDEFTMINDSFGYECGDEILKKVAHRIKTVLKENDIMARIGGDQFSIILNSLSCKEHISNICSEIINAVKLPFAFNDGSIFISTSLGASVYPFDGIDSGTLIKNADIAMYNAKENGKGLFEVCSTIMRDNFGHAVDLTKDLHKALEANEFEVYYQPQVDIKTGRVAGVEALLRWHHKKLGMIRPDIFIPIAEKTGLIVDIGRWVLYTSCMQKKAWSNMGIEDLSIGVNLSVNQMRGREIIKQVEDIITETGVNPEDIELEITENVLIKDRENIIRILDELKKMKIRIAIDDFGLEYSSLNYLKHLPVDRIKIAKPFIDGIGRNTGDESIISAIIIIGRELGLNLIAEGVETEEQLQFLKDQNCDEVQGFYYYKPAPASVIEKNLV